MSRGEHGNKGRLQKGPEEGSFLRARIRNAHCGADYPERNRDFTEETKTF
jgi:hypothetical protein